MARATPAFLPGFPDFAALVQELQKVQDPPLPKYEVCVGLADGSLVIKENLIQLWTEKNDLFQSDAVALVAEHNKVYNPQGVKRGAEDAGNGEAEGAPPEKRIRIDQVVKATEHESSIEDKLLGGKPWQIILYLK